MCQVSLLSRFLIPKRRDLEVQSQPTENLQVSAPRCWPRAQHSPTQSHLPWKASDQTSKPTHALKGPFTRQQGEPLTQCSSGQPGAASAALCCRSLDPLAPPHTLPPATTSHPQSRTGMVLLPHCCSQLQQSCPSLTLALLTSCCPKPHGVWFWSKCYSPIALSHFQR